jgi:putative flippase GtrA
MRETVGLIARFGLVGLVNTAIGFAVVVLLDPVLGVPPALANAASYTVGITVGFLLSRNFVFRSRARLSATGLRYLIAALGAFALNQVVLRLVGLALGAGSIQHIAAQLSAMAVYSAVFFLVCRLWVFKAVASLPAA